MDVWNFVTGTNYKDIYLILVLGPVPNSDVNF